MVKRKILNEREIFSLKNFIKEIVLLNERGPAMASGVDPTSPQGFYSYDIPTNDVHSFWYRSPGRSMGSDGDPGRPDSASKYIGLEPPAPETDTGSASDTESAPAAAEGPALF